MEFFTLISYRGSHGVMVSTLDFESSDPSSNLGGTYLYIPFLFIFLQIFFKILFINSSTACPHLLRLRFVSNFSDGDCKAGEIHTRARNFEETRRGAPLASHLLEISSARVCISPTPHSPSLKLETNRSLPFAVNRPFYRYSSIVVIEIFFTLL